MVRMKKNGCCLGCGWAACASNWELGMKDLIGCLETMPHGGRMFIARDVLVRGTPFLSSCSCEETDILGDVKQLGLCIEMLIYGLQYIILLWLQLCVCGPKGSGDILQVGFVFEVRLP